MDEKDIEITENSPSDAQNDWQNDINDNGITADNVADTDNAELVSDDESVDSDKDNIPSDTLVQNEINGHEKPLNDIIEPQAKPFKADGIFEFVELFIFTIATVILLLSFVCRHSVVDGDSMQNTLQDGEHLIISDLFYSPKQFDVIVFEDRSTGVDKPMVKRIIALEGDTVKITNDGSVYVNDMLLDEKYVFIDGYFNQREIEYKVQPGEVYVMGDHRNESSDSRMYGSIDTDTILGKVILRFYPFEKFGTID